MSDDSKPKTLSEIEGERRNLRVKPISRRTFSYKGKVVEELLFTGWDGPRTKLAWTLFPFEAVMVDGVKNFIFHSDF